MSSHADRQRAYRRRQNDGEAVLPVRTAYNRLCEALIASGRLSEAEALEREAVTAAAAAVLDDFIDRWTEK
jgi:hypothetical protein